MGSSSSAEESPERSKLVKVEEQTDPNNNNIKYYIYKRKFTNTHGQEQESIIKVKYEKTTHQRSSRDTATAEIIEEIKNNEYPTVQAALEDYVQILHDRHSDIKPYTYNAFSKRWASRLS